MEDNSNREQLVAALRHKGIKVERANEATKIAQETKTSTQTSHTKSLSNTAPASFSPSAFTWQIDFYRNCQTDIISEGNGTGIKQHFCDILHTEGGDNADMVPVVLTAVQIFELDIDLAVLNVWNALDLNLKNGDTFDYVSIGSSDKSVALGGMNLRLRGENAAGVEIINDILVQYTNECDRATLATGDSIGWIVVVSTCCESVC